MCKKDRKHESRLLTGEELEQRLRKCATQEERDKLASEQLAIWLESIVWAAMLIVAIILIFGVILR